MLFPVGQPSTAWTAAPRTFLGPVVPGYISTAGTVCLPLHLDGRITDTAIPYDDRDRISDFVRRNASHFASRNSILNLNQNESDYRLRVQPTWLTALWDDTCRVVEEYALRPNHSRRVLDVLRESLARFQPLVSGLLYAGPCALPPGDFVLFPQDMALYAQPIRREPMNPYPLLQFLGTLLHVERLLGWGLTDRVLIQDGEGEEIVHRPFDSIDLHFSKTIDFVDASGSNCRFNRADVRPDCLYIADETGRIDVHQGLQATTHPAYRGFQLSLLRETNILLGFFLFAFHDMGSAELDLLRRQVPRSSSRAKEGFHGHIVTAALDSLFSSQ